MKNISSQLNRGTELLKQTVQRAIFSSSSASKVPASPQPPPVTTAKPTPYHSDPHAVTRSSSVDSLHLETCHIRPIRPYSLTPFRRGTFLNCPTVIRPEQPEDDLKFNPLKVKARFKLQKGAERSAFCSLANKGKENKSSLSPAKVKKSPNKSAGRGAKRKRSEVEDLEEDEPEETIITNTTSTTVSKRGKKTAPETRQNNNKKAETKKQQQSKAAKRKSLEQEKQEREDFELAKRLQKELNSSAESNATNGTSASGGGSTRRTRNGRSLNGSATNATTSYSLRTTRSLSKFSLSSVSLEVDVDVEEDQAPAGEELQGKFNKKTTKKPSPPSNNKKNGLKATSTRKRIQRVKEEQEVQEVQKTALKPQPRVKANHNNTDNKRMTRSKGSCGSTK